MLEPKVYIIGAGPGDPELLTVKAYKILTQADVVVYADSLIPEKMLADIRSDCEVIKTADKTLEEIIKIMIDRVNSSRSVVRLHSGDLTIYSAIAEQIQLLKAANILLELIPGIGVFQAAAAKLNLELTVPDLVQTIILTRISGNASQVPKSEDLADLAAHHASICLYLSARHVQEAETKLSQHYPADTPVAICFRVGWKDEKIIVVTLKEMAKVTLSENLIRTTLYIISPALSVDNFTRSKLYHPEHSHLFRS